MKKKTFELQTKKNITEKSVTHLFCFVSTLEIVNMI